MNKQTKVYKVAPGRIASSRADGKNYHEGEKIDLSHCTLEEIANLIVVGLVVEDAEPTATHALARSASESEVTNG